MNTINNECTTKYSKTLVFNGSPKNGVSKSITNNIEKKYKDVEVINAYDYNIKACIDCSYCSEHVCKCVFDDMNDIYEKIANANNIIVVSPVHVGSISAPLLSMFSRLQIYFANKFDHKNDFPFNKKHGFAIAVSGNDWVGQKDGMEVIFKHAFLEMNASFDYYCYLTNNDSNSDFDIDMNEFYREVDKYVSK